MLGTHGHCAVSVLKLATPTVTRGILHNGHLRGPVTLIPVAERLAVELSLPVFTTYVCRSVAICCYLTNKDVPQPLLMCLATAFTLKEWKRTLLKRTLQNILFTVF